MNNENNDTQNTQNENETMSAISLGSVASNGTISMDNDVSSSIPSIDPVPTVPEVTSTPDVSVSPVSSETVPVGLVPPLDVNTPVSENIGVIPDPNTGVGMPVNEANVTSTTDIPPVAPVNYDVPEPINSVDPIPMLNDIGTMPPIPDVPVVNPPASSPDDKKKSGGMNKLVFVIVVVLALTAVGVGVYILLHMSGLGTSPVVPKKVNIEIGSKLSVDINDYATFNKIDSNSCTLDTTEIPGELNELSKEYPFRITCNGTVYSGKVKVVDTVKPVVTKVDEVQVVVNTDVSPEEFIKNCEDSTRCSYSFKEEAKVKENIKNVGDYHVDVIVKDEADNETVITSTMKVVDDAPQFIESQVYLTVSMTTDNYLVSTKLGINDDGSFNKSALRTYTFTLSAEEYSSLKESSKDKTTVTYNDITGSPEFSDDNNTLSLVKVLSYDDLNSEDSEELPMSVGEIRTYYEAKGYTCAYEYGD